MIPFNPARRAFLTKDSEPTEPDNHGEPVYVHGISEKACLVEYRLGEIRLVSLEDHSLKFDPNTASFAEAKLRLQGMEVARMPVDNKK
jgi:hypothetical protein